MVSSFQFHNMANSEADSSDGMQHVRNATSVFRIRIDSNYFLFDNM